MSGEQNAENIRHKSSPSEYIRLYVFSAAPVAHNHRICAVRQIATGLCVLCFTPVETSCGVRVKASQIYAPHR